MYTGWKRRWPQPVVDCDTDSAVSLIRRYYGKRADGRPVYSGSQFESVAARNAHPDTIGPDEFSAVSLLSVAVTGHAALRLLSQADEIARLLARIPNVDIVDAEPDILESGSAPANQLWKLLRSGKDGIGRTTTSKLMAAKRPRLIPIWDSFIEHATGLDTIGYWRRFQLVLLADDRRIWNWLNDVRGNVPGLPDHVSTLRVLDVLLWMLVETDALN
ncbi:hypothetical protein A5635_21825 [Mycobacterium asiaticum]|uniref:Uncharacterized protein n=1 Tax=Mycobacterium asiaticum TaxID=1790 RepID=A0A1A3NQ25_MYCAS|nr:DUF6308 family protein [Mycobacterium asiaticum]OBK22392.1 hypothetical protein A5635_21825 [Mycobacterium asiaticum]